MRTKTKGTKITAIFIALTMLMSISTGIMANEPKQDYVVTYQAEEITDTDTLIEMALGQPKSNARSATVSDGQLEVKQLLEVREYKDGSIQKDFASAVFMGIDENGTPLSRAFFNHSTSSSSLDYGLNLYTTAYYTYQTGQLVGSYRINSVVNTIARVSGNVTPTRLRVSTYYGNRPSWSYNCSFASTQSFTTNITDTNFYVLVGGSLEIQNLVDVSNGSYIVTHIFLSDDTIIN